MQCYSFTNVVTIDLQNPDPIVCACVATVLHVWVWCVRACVCVCVKDIQQLDLAVTGDLYGVDQDRQECHRIVQTRQQQWSSLVEKAVLWSCGRRFRRSGDLKRHKRFCLA